MRWLELVIAIAIGGVVVAFQLLSGPWCEPASVKGAAALIIVISFLIYIHLVDSERRGGRATHRVLAGICAGLAVAAVLNAPTEGYALALLIGGAWATSETTGHAMYASSPIACQSKRTPKDRPAATRLS